MGTIRRASAFLFMTALLAIACRADDRATLMEGVKEIAVPGAPGPLCVFGESAFVVMVDEGKVPAPVVAAGTLDKGRLVAFGHNGYFDAANAKIVDTAKLLANAATWAAAQSPRAGKGNRVIGLRGCKTLEPVLRDAGLKPLVIDGGELSSKLSTVDAVMLPAGDIHDGDLPVLEAFVRRGGGAITGVPGWGFLATHPGATLSTDLGANHLFAKGGIVWAEGTADGSSAKRFIAHADLSPMLNSSAALKAVVEESKGGAALSKTDATIAAAALSRAAQSLPPDDAILLPHLEKVAKENRDKALVSEKADLLAGNSLARVVLTFDLSREKSLPPEQVKAHPLAKTFPGEVPSGAPRVQREVAVDLSIPDWHSTGLYAAPGEVVTVSLPGNAPAGLKVRIGCHSDHLWSLAAWQRAPEIDRTWPLKPGTTKIASGFGGLIFIVVPGKASPGNVAVSIGNAVEAPLFVLGQTDARKWRETIRRAPGPWAEVTSEKVSFIVPSKFVRELDDPGALMTWWDKALDGAADLYQIPHKRPRAERYVADVQISAGYMHSGYPIMTHLDAAPRMVDLPTVRTKGEWGLFHELGHNHQKSEWTFPGTGEVTNNLLPLYLLETLCNNAPLHASFTAQARAKAEVKYMAGGADFATWQKEPFTALIMYQQLRDGFGWAAFQKVFAEYRDLPQDQRPKSEVEKHDQWMVRFSRACGKNLGPFFQKWGVPTSEGARKSIENLSAWSPTGK